MTGSRAARVFRLRCSLNWARITAAINLGQKQRPAAVINPPAVGIITRVLIKALSLEALEGRYDTRGYPQVNQVNHHLFGICSLSSPSISLLASGICLFCCWSWFNDTCGPPELNAILVSSKNQLWDALQEIGI